MVRVLACQVQVNDEDVLFSTIISSSFAFYLLPALVKSMALLQKIPGIYTASFI
jgi:hypothetical protein